jgi:hypothetical protein
MMKPLAALGLMSAGVTALAGLGYLQTHRFAFTSPSALEANPPSVHATSAAALPREPVITEGPSELVIFKRPLRLAPPAALRAAPDLVPCTEWRDLGPVSRSDESAPAQRRVQMLCAAGTRPPPADL